MKLLNLVTGFLAAIALLSACEKIDDPGGDSLGTLMSELTGNCTPITVNGIFKADSVLTSDNYVDVQVNVTFGGSFNIKSDTVNGYSFSKKGTVGAGTNTIRLYASGKPAAIGTNTFTIIYGTSSCSFLITVFGPGGIYGTSLYTLGGAPGNCSVSAISGNYIVGQAATALNKVETTVNVNNVGTYNITGPAVNGVTFTGSGTFSNPGVQNIFLYASGIPSVPGTFNYPITNGATNCNFSITYTTVVINATFALSGSPGNCTAAVINGNYTAGTVLTAANTAVINVNVTSPGNYSITTASVNGISFSASGTFNITGPQQVTLKGSGIPAAAGVFNYPVTGAGNTCGITITTL